ncbi:hypothetical protein BC835DRAFT_582336 [Cytidiella melzeri]|nr:hypothetical protein BC835DRAFT_582336 [Cytidiella melzeri]
MFHHIDTAVGALLSLRSGSSIRSSGYSTRNQFLWEGALQANGSVGRWNKRICVGALSQSELMSKVVFLCSYTQNLTSRHDERTEGFATFIYAWSSLQDSQLPRYSDSDREASSFYDDRGFVRQSAEAAAIAKTASAEEQAAKQLPSSMRLDGCKQTHAPTTRKQEAQVNFVAQASTAGMTFKLKRSNLRATTQPHYTVGGFELTRPGAAKRISYGRSPPGTPCRARTRRLRDCLHWQCGTLDDLVCGAGCSFRNWCLRSSHL